MTMELLVNGIELLALVYIILKSRGWDGPSLRAAIDTLNRDVRTLKHDVNKTDQATRSNTTEIEFIKGDISTLKSDIFQIQGRIPVED